MSEVQVMAARIIDGRAIAREIRGELKSRIVALAERGVTPGLAAVLVGDDPASAVYVKTKRKTAERLGIRSEILRRPGATTQPEMERLVDELNERADIHGYIIQSPLPSGLDEPALVQRVDPRKDVDGFHPVNVGLMSLGMTGHVPCTPLGIVEMLRRSKIETAGADVVIVGRGSIVGKPLAALLTLKRPGGNATVTLCHTRTRDLEVHTRRADILILAVGKPEWCTGEMVKPGVTVIDVGVNRVDDPSVEKGYRLVGDAQYESIAAVAGAITPVPGGVGPMTVAMLMSNAVDAAEGVAG